MYVKRISRNLCALYFVLFLFAYHTHVEAGSANGRTPYLIPHWFDSGCDAGILYDETNIVAKDVDNDGDMDIVENCQGGIYAHEQTEPNRFITHLVHQFPTDSPDEYRLYLDSFVLVDYDGNNHFDILTRSNKQLTLFTHEGAFAFTQSIVIDHDETNENQSLRAGDIDQDGNQDLLLKTSQYDAILYGDGEGDFRSHILPEAPFDLSYWGLADLDLDGDLDFIATSPWTASWVKEEKEEEEEEYVYTPLPYTYIPGGKQIVTDFDNNGHPDIVWSNHAIASADDSGVPDQLFWVKNEGNGPETVQYIGDEYVRILGVTDYDEDGQKDILGQCRAFYFDTLSDYVEEKFPCEGRTLLDFDGDGDLDVLADSRTQFGWYENFGMTDALHFVMLPIIMMNHESN